MVRARGLGGLRAQACARCATCATCATRQWASALFRRSLPTPRGSPPASACDRLVSLQSVDFVQILVQFSVLLLSLTVHEAAHAWTADRLGDPTARQLGRVTLNPAAHVDLIGTVLFPLVAMISN